MSKEQHYPLGYSGEETKRLADQAAQVAPLTEDIYATFLQAGLPHGFHVQDRRGVDSAQRWRWVMNPDGTCIECGHLATEHPNGCSICDCELVADSHRLRFWVRPVPTTCDEL